MRPSLHCSIYLTFLWIPAYYAKETLKSAQSRFIQELSQYTKELESKINTIEGFLAEVSAKRQQWSPDPEAYVANPLNSYALIRRLHEDWSFFEAYMSESVGPAQTANVNKLIEMESPKVEELEKAMEALLYLQSHYDLDAKQLAEGMIDGNKYSAQLGTLDCFALAEFCQRKSLQHFALAWQRAALEQFNYAQHAELYGEVYQLSVSDLYGMYATMLANSGYIKEALDVLNNAADSHISLWLQRRALQNFGQHLKANSSQKLDNLTTAQRGCRGQYPAVRKLFCYYRNSTEPLLMLARFKVELLSMKPYVALYHDVVYDKEIEDLLYIRHDGIKYDRFEQYASKTIHLELNRALHNRLRAMTGTNMDFGKDFELQYDGLALKPEKQQPQSGSLTASITLFLNDVPQGGATIIPDHQLYIKPEKGFALISHVLDSQRRLNYFSCPVLVGCKW
ncbi:hypothetical protein AWZ03_010017, partial [Drosophila navojoa]